MDRSEVAARYIAFATILNNENSASPEEAGRFARKNWPAFLPCASDELGTFLTRNSVVAPDSVSRVLIARRA
jgi:hypothetical protein